MTRLVLCSVSLLVNGCPVDLVLKKIIFLNFIIFHLCEDLFLKTFNLFHLCEDVDSMTQGRVECWGLFSTCLPRVRVWVIVQNWEIRKWKWCFPVLGSKQFLKYHYTQSKFELSLSDSHYTSTMKKVQENKLIDLSRTLCISPCTIWHIFAWEIFFGPETCLYSKCFCTIGLQQMQPVNLRSEDCFVLRKTLIHFFGMVS